MSNKVMQALTDLLREAEAITVVVGAKAWKLSDDECPVHAAATLVRSRLARIVDAERRAVEWRRTQAGQTTQPGK